MPAPLVWLMIVALAVAAVPPPSAQKVVGKLRVEITLDKATYLRGESVTVRLTARNEGESPTRVQFSSGQRFDLIIRRRGALIWRWSHDKAFIQKVDDVTLGPGETLTFRATWEQLDLQGRRVDPGEYEAAGVFLGRASDAQGSIETPPLAFQIRE